MNKRIFTGMDTAVRQTAKILFAAVFGLAATACSDSDDGPEPQPKPDAEKVCWNSTSDKGFHTP